MSLFLNKTSAKKTFMKNERKVCLNCGAELLGFYCHECGQKSEVARVTWRSLFDEFTSKWIGWDNKFFRTVKGLTIAPGHTIREYLDGNRVSFIGPVGYLFLMSVILLLIYDVFHIDLAELYDESQRLLDQGTTIKREQETQAFQKVINRFMAEYYKMVLVAGIPFMALSSVIFFRKVERKFNFLENVVFYFYTIAHSIWGSIFMTGAIVMFGTNPQVITSIVTIVYYIYALYLFQRRKGIFGVFSSFVTILVGYLFFIFVGIILGTIYMIAFTDVVHNVQQSPPSF